MEIATPSRMSAGRQRILLTVMIAGTAAVFVFDSATPVEVTAGVLYVPLVLMAVRLFRPQTVLVASMGGVALTVTSHFLSPGDPWNYTALINRALGISTIGIATVVALRNRLTEVALQRAELDRVTRLVTLGELAASIAHEVNQPLGAMVTNANACLQWLAKQPPNLHEARQAAQGIVKDGHRASEVLQRIRALIKGSPSRKEPFNVNEMIVEALTLTRTEVERHNVLLQVLLPDDLPLVLGDRIQLQQVVLNLLVNAIEAMRECNGRQRNLQVSSRKNDTDTILITVRDTGPGLAAENLDRVFEPFHTTKAEGMGMGLAICRSIIMAHDGQLWAANVSPRGAVFQFTLPALQI
jgi:C4-dicarboxylate-specific signal transduction histidine kinase